MNKLIKMLLTLLIISVVFSRLLDGEEPAKEENEKKEGDEQSEKTEEPATEEVKVDENQQTEKPAESKTEEPAEKKENTEKSRKFLFIGLAVVFLGAGALGGAYLWHKKSSNE